MDDLGQIRISDALPSLFSNEGSRYPVQTTQAADDQHNGEYRGFYLLNSQDWWKPTSSKFGARSYGHNGADIYAPRFPFPCEMPVLAVVGGSVSFRTDALSPNALGNRAVLDTEAGGRPVQLFYGHLARFHGRSRTVNKGDLIGFAGCSGNADNAGECSKAGECRVNSGHVHLTAAFGTKSRMWTPPASKRHF